MPILQTMRGIVLLTSLTITLCSCTSLSYYSQSVRGQWQVNQQRRDIDEMINHPETPAQLRQRLKKILSIRQYASSRLLLPDNESYRSFADIGRKYVVWNIFATPRLSLEPHQSCFPIVGCLAYRGYFQREKAESYAEGLRQRDFDVYVGGVAAYSTLGWFNDPILNGMLERSDVELARLLFHELAHQLLYIQGDSEFNEAFAEAVALIGVNQWLEEYGSASQSREFRAQLKREAEFTSLVLSYRSKLAALYDSTESNKSKLRCKTELFGALRKDYAVLRDAWGSYSGYDSWFEQDLNNAKLAAISTYQLQVPVFQRLYDLANKEMEVFYTRVRQLAECKQGNRTNIAVNQWLTEFC